MGTGKGPIYFLGIGKLKYYLMGNENENAGNWEFMKLFPGNREMLLFPGNWERFYLFPRIWESEILFTGK